MALPHRDRLPASTTASRLTSVVSFANAALGNKIRRPLGNPDLLLLSVPMARPGRENLTLLPECRNLLKS